MTASGADEEWPSAPRRLLGVSRLGKRMKFGAKIVRHGCSPRLFTSVVHHGRHVTFQMADVAVPRDLFREILRLIDGLRPPRPAPA